MYHKYMLVIFSFFVYFSFAYAESSHVKKETLHSLLTKVEHAKPSQRRLLMNELKVHLRQMHQSERTRVMLGLRRAFNTQKNIPHTMSMRRSSMRHENTMNLAASKHMQEYKQEPNKVRPTGNRPAYAQPNGTPPSVDTHAPSGKHPEHGQPKGSTSSVGSHVPVRDTSKNKPTKNKPTTQNVPPKKTQQTKPPSKRAR